MSTPFDRLLGSSQGRVQPSGWAAPDGAYVFVLGSDVPGQLATLAGGDYTQVAQVGRFDLHKLLRFRARLRAPSTVPAGTHWRADLLIDGVTKYSWYFPAGQTRTLSDQAWPVDALGPGDHEIAFRLVFANFGAPVLAELPAFYLDDLTFDDSPHDPAIVNRNPEPNETRWPQDGGCQFDLVDFSGGGIDLGSIGITINGVAACTAGVQQAPFIISITQVEPDVVHVVVNPPAPEWTSAEVVTVAVAATCNGGAHSLSASYQFTALRTTPPGILSAVSRDQKIVRVTWDDELLEVSAANANDALNPTNYAIARAGADRSPSVAVAVVAVAPLSSSVVDLTLDIPITPGAPYVLTATHVEDTQGNVASSPTNSATFTGFQPDRPADRDFDFWSMLPEMNRSEDASGDLQAFVACLQEVLDLLLVDIDKFVEIIDPDLAPIAFVDAILADLGNPFTFDLADDDKRRLARLLAVIYKTKGTTPGMIGAVAFFVGVTITIDSIGFAACSLGVSELGVDWELGTSDAGILNTLQPVSGITLTATQVDQITQILEYMKPAESHLLAIAQPAPAPPAYDPVELGISELGVDWLLH